MVWVTLFIMLAVLIMGDLSYLMFGTTDGETETSAYEDIVKSREYARRLSGRCIDDALIKEMQLAYGDMRIIYYGEEENQTDTGFSMRGSAMAIVEAVDDGRSDEQIWEDHRKYNDIYLFVESISGYESVLTVDEEELYQIRQDEIMQDWVSDYSLSEEEEALWKEREEKLQKPFVYEYCIGFCMLFGQINMIDYLWILLCAICLSGFFSDEHLRRTDQIVLCSRYGKTPVYLAKMAAGVTLALGGTVLFFAVGTLLALGIYGADGFHASIQLSIWMSSWDISIGEAVCVLFSVSLCGALCCSVITMMLSEILHNAVAVLSLVSGFMIFTFFVNVPPRYGVLSQMYALIPTRLINEIGFLDNRMFHVFGRYFSALQAAPVVYLVLAGWFVGIGYVVYGRYQVKGR